MYMTGEVAWGVQVAGLIGVVAETALHVAGAGLGHPCHQFLVDTRIVENLRHHVIEVLDVRTGVGGGFALHFFLNPVIILLHE